jgi:hypothetical protein
MGKAFQVMLEHFGLKEKILVVNADNATANDNQTTKLDALNNSFEEANQVQCFNHTLQLSAKALLVPSNTAISRNVIGDDEVPEEDSDNELLPEVGQDDGDGDGEGDNNNDNEEEEEGNDDKDDGINELQDLSQNERVQILQSTAVVRVMVTKV